MHSKLRPCSIGRWFTLTACSLVITVSFSSCTISADAGPSPAPRMRFSHAVTSPW